MMNHSSLTRYAMPAGLLLWAALAGCDASATNGQVGDAGTGTDTGTDAMASDSAVLQPADWRLPPENFIPAKMPIRLVHPRPDSETNAWARHRKAYPGIPYRIPVSVQGGAYPFYYEIIEGPPGMQIGQQYGVPDYGIASWVPDSESGSYAVKIRVTDQELNQVDAEFEVTATTSGFVFVDPEGAEGGDGSIGSPLKRFSQTHDNNASAGTQYAGYIVYLRGGQHQTKDNGTSNYLELRADRNPMTILGYPGEHAELDCSNAGIHVGGGTNGDDFFASGFVMKNSPPTRENSRFFSFWNTSGNRSTIFDVAFENHVSGTVGNDNAHHIHFGAQDGWTEYVTFWGLKFSKQASKGSSVGSTYQTRYVVVEDCRFGKAQADVRPNAAVFMKSESTYWSLRRNLSIEQGHRSATLFQYAGNRKPTPQVQLVEMCYNLLRAPDPAVDSTVIYTAWPPGTATDVGHPDNTTWIYRNTILGGVGGTDRRHNTMVFDSNVYLTDGQWYLDDTGLRVVVVVGNDLTGTSSDVATMLDQEYRLQGSYRDDYLGQRGHEVSP
jgi:hypothetical protein